MAYIELVDVGNTGNDLEQEASSFLLRQSGVFHNVFEEFASFCVLHDQIERIGGVDYLQLDENNSL